jgi:hypothetical protein
MAKALLRQYIRGDDRPQQPADVKSQLAWQKRRRLETGALLTLSEIEAKGIRLPNFSNIRERIGKKETTEPPYDDAVDSLSSSEVPERRRKRQPQGGESHLEKYQNQDSQLEKPNLYTRDLTPEEAIRRQKWLEEDAPPRMIRLVERQSWMWSMEKASLLEISDIADPIFLSKEQWDRIVRRGGANLYSAAVDRRWPGFHNQPWFVNTDEVNDAYEERRISRDYKKLCCKLLTRFGDCLNTTQKMAFGVLEFDAMVKSRTGTLEGSPSPDRTVRISDTDQIDGGLGSSQAGVQVNDSGTVDEDNIHFHTPC